MRAERSPPASRPAVTWEYGGEVSWVTVRLADDPDGGARLELEHVAHVGDDRWAQFGPGAVGVGWDLAFLGLGEHFTRAPAGGVLPRTAGRAGTVRSTQALTRW